VAVPARRRRHARGDAGRAPGEIAGASRRGPDAPRLNMPATDPVTPRRSPRALRIVDLVRPHWKALTLAFVAVLGETLTDVADPFPIKWVVDNVLHSKPLPGALGSVVAAIFGHGAYAVLNFAVTAVAVVAIVGAV